MSAAVETPNAAQQANPQQAAVPPAQQPQQQAGPGSAAASTPNAANPPAQGAAATAATGTSHPMASLYVGDLHPEVNEATLYDKFSAIGPVLTIRVCRDMITRRSLGYAYVNFQHPEDAERAIDIMNFNPLKGKPIRIMWSQRDPSLRRSGVGNIFIKNLDKAIDNKAIYDTFSSFGNILSCKVATDEDGVSKGYGFVHFETEESANRAIARVNGCILNQRPVYVGKFIPKVERDRNSDPKNIMFNNCFVKNFPRDMTDVQFMELFQKFGAVSSCTIMRTDKGESKGFGFVSYEQPEEAMQAVEALHGTEQGGDLPFYIARAQKKAERLAELRRSFEQKRQEVAKQRQNSNLYVKNLDDDINDEKLHDIFKDYGEISSYKVMCDDKGKSRGFGFVAFANAEDATKAMAAMNNSQLGNKPLYVAPAQRKEERMALMQNQIMSRMPTNFRPMPPQMQYQFMPTGMPMAPSYGQRGPQPFYQNAAFNTGMRGPNPLQPWARPNAGYGMGGSAGPQGNYRGAQRGGAARGMPGRGQMGGMPPNMDQRQPQQGPPMQHRPSAAAVQQQMSAQRQQQQPGAPPVGGPPQQAVPPVQQNVAPQVPGGIKQYSAVAAAPPQPAPQPASMRAGRQPQPAPGQRPPATHHDGPLDAQNLASMNKTEQKQVLGEKLYPLVEKCCNPEHVGKVTGMLLDSMENTDILVLLDSAGHDTLKSKVEEACSMIQQHKVPNKAGSGAGDKK